MKRIFIAVLIPVFVALVAFLCLGGAAPPATSQALPFLEVGKGYQLPGKSEFQLLEKLNDGWLKVRGKWIGSNREWIFFVNTKAVEAIIPDDQPDLASIPSNAPAVAENSIEQANIQPEAAKTTRAVLMQIESALERYAIDIDRYPTEQEGGLNALIQKPKFADAGLEAKWAGPYLPPKTKFQDSWGRAFRYEPAGNASAYKLYSVGPDGRAGTADDLSPNR